MMTLGEILRAATPGSSGIASAIPPEWMQGRTSFGGLSSALALHAALAEGRRDAMELPPLRSAQIAFVGPLAGPVTLHARTLRRGRNAVWMEADVVGEAGIGTRGLFLFMAERASAVDHDTLPRADETAPAPDTEVMRRTIPQFAANFELARAQANKTAAWSSWARLADRADIPREVELLAVADVLPPAALRLFNEPQPISSLTWQVDFLSPTPDTRDGWWLVQSETSRARSGFSSQRMALYNAEGTPILTGMQSVAVFG